MVEPARNASSGGIVGPQALAAEPGGTARFEPKPASMPGGWNNLEHIPAAQVIMRPDPDLHAIYHEVRSGETLNDLAARYRVPAPRLIRANGLDATSTLKPGQLIYIPAPE